jgi:putative restriction endonuclease
MAVFAWLDRVTEGGELPVSWGELQNGFAFRGVRVTLVGQKGIWKPEQAQLPISIITAPPRASGEAPYDDAITDDGLLRYRYEGTDPTGYRNRWLRECHRHQVPLVYLHGVSAGAYMASWPAMITADDPASLAVDVAIIDPARIRPDLSPLVADAAEQRFYTRLTRQRLEQATFRASVMRAYRHSCSVCRLRHTELLDAAHIVSFAENGPSTVDNGLSLCKIHHASYDHNILGVSPSFELHLRKDLLDEIDGPMLRHGLQAIHGQRLVLPRRPADRPRHDLLERRWDQFKLAG